MPLDQLPERPIGDERAVSVYDEEHAVLLASEGIQGNADRIAGAELLPLQDWFGVAREHRLHQLGLVADDYQKSPPAQEASGRLSRS